MLYKKLDVSIFKYYGGGGVIRKIHINATLRAREVV